MAIAVRQLFRERAMAFGGAAKTARALGCSRTFVHYLMTPGSGKRPGREMERDIETLFEIPRDAWESVEAERAA